ncbi:hypothetical protein IJF81_03735 [bacterium]|nr:hypothetical protein [bacterium]
MNLTVNCDGCRKPQYQQSFGMAFKIDSIAKEESIHKIISKGMPSLSSSKKSDKKLWQELDKIIDSQKNNKYNIYLGDNYYDNTLHAYINDPNNSAAITLAYLNQKNTIFGNRIIKFFKECAAKADELLRAEQSKGNNVLNKIN